MHCISKACLRAEIDLLSLAPRSTNQSLKCYISVGALYGTYLTLIVLRSFSPKSVNFFMAGESQSFPSIFHSYCPDQFSNFYQFPKKCLLLQGEKL